MHRLPLSGRKKSLRLVCLGAHCDDIEIGAGGLLLSLLCEGVRVHAQWCVASGSPARVAEAQRSARAFLEGAAETDLRFASFRDGYFPAEWAGLKDWVETLRGAEPPDLVLTHRRDDAHQDHRTISELTWTIFRESLILEYEIPKWDGDLAAVNAYSPIAAPVMARKIRLLMECFASQREKPWFSEDTFKGIARLRGIECRQDFAEGFLARKVVL